MKRSSVDFGTVSCAIFTLAAPFLGFESFLAILLLLESRWLLLSACIVLPRVCTNSFSVARTTNGPSSFGDQLNKKVVRHHVQFHKRVKKKKKMLSAFFLCLKMIKVIKFKFASPTSLVGLRQFHGTNFGDFFPVSTVE